MANTSVLPSLPPKRPPGFNPYRIDGFPEVHMRRNIIEWSESTSDADVRSWNLLLKALLNFQSCGEDVKNPTGYYQIAGVHGAPYVHWDNEPREEGDMPGNYCAHGSALFLTWHTPYQLLFEQRLVEEAMKYAKSLSPKYQALYCEAAKQIRFPYWDWATDARLPKPIRDEKCNILIPQPGSDDPPLPICGHNPLYSYRFQNPKRLSRDFAVSNRAWRLASQTLRCPDHHGNSRPEIADKQLTTPSSNPRRPNNFRDGVHRLLTSVGNYGSFSNTGWPRVLCRVMDCDDPDCPTQHFSLEEYHNTVHVFTGTDLTLPAPPAPGHMVDSASAAFDPVFWLHHCNVDRLYAMWQAINYKAEFQDQRVEATRLPDVCTLETEDTHDSKLRPFYKTDNDPASDSGFKVWVNNMVQRGGGHIPSRLPYGYTYPELVIHGEPDPTPERLAEHVRAEAQRLYGPPDRSTFHEPRKYPDDHELLQYRADLDFRRAWNVILKVKRSLILNNFTIFFFLRNPGEDARSWSTHDYRVGSFSTFKGQAEHCVNCANQEAADAYMKGGIDITEAVYYRLQQTQPGKNLDDEEEIERLLKDELTWKLLDHETGQGIDLEEILKYDPKALLIITTSFLVPYFKDPSLFEGKYRGLHPQLGLTQRKNYKSVTHDKRRFGGWSQND